MSEIDRRVCVIGNSYIGAVYRAYKDLKKPDDKHYSFFAAPGYHFAEVGFEDSLIKKPPFGEFDDLDMRSYGFFVLYGHMMSPTECHAYEQSIVKSRCYSSQVIDAAVRDRVRDHTSIRIAETLNRIVDRPIFVLPRNNHIHEKLGSQANRREGESRIASSIKPMRFLPFPPELFKNENANEDYYKGSLNMMGCEPDRQAQPDHHTYHMNKEGGALILREIQHAIARWELLNSAQKQTPQVVPPHRRSGGWWGGFSRVLPRSPVPK